MALTKRFTGLTLTKVDRVALAERQRGRVRLSARTWRRIRVLELLDEGLSLAATAKAVGSYPREMGRVAKRYLARGLEAALTDDARGAPERRLDSTQEAALVALVCGPAPAGRARWTIRLLAEEAQRRDIVPRVGREVVRVVLSRHELKPWREKNVVRTANRPGVRKPDGRRAARLRSAVRPS